MAEGGGSSMAVGDSYHSGPDISLPGLIRNSAFSGYVKSMISSPNFLSVVTSIKRRQDAVTLAQTDVCDKLNSLPAHEKEALYSAFPRTPAAFSNVLAYWLLHLSEMNQANFEGENTKEPNGIYKLMIQNNPLVAFSTVSYNHVFVYRRYNNWRKALQDKVNGCNLVSKYHYFLTSAVKQMALIHLSALCRTIDTDQGFLDNQMHSSNFRNSMETARRILLDYLLSADDPRSVTKLRLCHHQLQQISDLAAAASINPSNAVQVHGPCSTPSPSRFFFSCFILPPHVPHCSS
jgi:hypothetical protein